jgi:FkbM family methyltransferase
VFFDVGAFVGPYTLLASRIVGPQGRVIAFEPDPRARAVLQDNLDANGVANVTVAPVALGDHEGTVSFFGSGDSVGHVGKGGEVEVDMTTLDAFCEHEGVEPDVMKMDIEGGEGLALPQSAVARRIREIVLEVHEPELRAQSIDPQQLLASLGPHRLIEPPDSGNYAVVITPGA